MKRAPSTMGLMAIAILAAILVAFAGGMEFANARHEAASIDALDSQAKFIAQADETEHAYRAKLRELETACSDKSVTRDW